MSGASVLIHVDVGLCHHDMARLRVADGGDGLQIRRVAENILNNQSQTTDKWWSSVLVVEQGANNSSM